MNNGTRCARTEPPSQPRRIEIGHEWYTNTSEGLLSLQKDLTGARGRLGAIFTRAQSGPSFDPQPSLEADGFRFVRLLGEREGLKFVEGVKA